LIAIIDATGPRAINCVAPSTVVAAARPENVCGTPCETKITARISASGNSTYTSDR